MTISTMNTPQTIFDGNLDQAAAGAIELPVEKIERGFFRPNPAGDGTTEHFLVALEDGEDSL